MKKLPVLALFLLLCLTLAPPACGADAPAYAAEGFSNASRLFDGQRSTYTAAKADNRVTVTLPGGIGGLYIEFDRPPQPWTLTVQGETPFPYGTKGFLHEYLDTSHLGGTVPPEEVSLTFPEGTVIADLYAFPAGEPIPDWVQVWQEPCKEADLLLLSSHSDDEQLFFAGVLPYYAVERDLQVQVAYVVQHFQANGVQDHQRPHEQLDGLWTVGIRHYPLISEFPDLYSESKDRAAALRQAVSVYERAGNSYEDFVGYIAACIRQCKPLVVVSHDFDGEYGHGTHVLCADALQTAVTAAADADQYPDSAEACGVWTVQKAYSHLYAENQITMDWDTPFESLGGKSPFQVTQDGFACHKSQHWTWFYRWIYGREGSPITKASQITSYSPCLYGLYHTTVGPDTAGGDFFENVETYAQQHERERQERLAAQEAEEQRKREEQEKAAELAREQHQKELEEALEHESRMKPIAALLIMIFYVLIPLILPVFVVVKLIKWLLHR